MSAPRSTTMPTVGHRECQAAYWHEASPEEKEETCHTGNYQSTELVNSNNLLMPPVKDGTTPEPDIPVAAADDEVYGFESILSHRKSRGGHYRFRVKWNTGEITSEPDKYLKEDDPTTFGEYLRSTGLSRLKRFSWVNNLPDDPTEASPETKEETRHNYGSTELVHAKTRVYIPITCMPTSTPISVGSKSQGNSDPKQTKSKVASKSKLPSKIFISHNRSNKSTIVTPASAGYGTHSYRPYRRKKFKSINEAEEWADARDGGLWVHKKKVHKKKQIQTGIPKEISVHLPVNSAAASPKPPAEADVAAGTSSDILDDAAGTSSDILSWVEI